MNRITTITHTRLLPTTPWYRSTWSADLQADFALSTANIIVLSDVLSDDQLTLTRVIQMDSPTELEFLTFLLSHPTFILDREVYNAANGITRVTVENP